jgi:nucleoside-diphosphate-sugar epimerase
MPPGETTKKDMLLKEHRIFVAGHRGMVGSALVKKLHNEGYCRIVTRTHAELDLTNQAAKIFAAGLKATRPR